MSFLWLISAQAAVCSVLFVVANLMHIHTVNMFVLFILLDNNVADTILCSISFSIIFFYIATPPPMKRTALVFISIAKKGNTKQTRKNKANTVSVVSISAL